MKRNGRTFTGKNAQIDQPITLQIDHPNTGIFLPPAGAN